MLAFASPIVRKVGLWFSAIILIVLTVLGYGGMKKRQGRIEKTNSDLKEISEHVEDKREAERRIRDVPVLIGERRSRLRAQRDKLKKLL